MLNFIQYRRDGVAWCVQQFDGLRKNQCNKKEEKLSIFLKVMLSSFKSNYCIRFKSKAKRGVARTWDMITLAGFIPCENDLDWLLCLQCTNQIQLNFS